MGRLLQIAHHLLSEKGGGRPSNPLLFPPSPFPRPPKKASVGAVGGMEYMMGLWAYGPKREEDCCCYSSLWKQAPPPVAVCFLAGQREREELLGWKQVPPPYKEGE